jgi:hypothetical protein
MDKDKIARLMEVYRRDNAALLALTAKHLAEAEELQALQGKRIEALLHHAGVEAFPFFTELYIEARDNKAQKEKEKGAISADQAKVEAWMLKVLDTVDGLKGLPTDFGTVYKTRKESVTMAEWDTFLEHAVLKGAAEAVFDEVYAGDKTIVREEAISSIVQIIKHGGHFEYLNKAISKAAALEVMGDVDKKGQRPNPPPPGTNYSAVMTVGVRKRS